MHTKQSHGGHATQAASRGEQYELCNTCGQRRHGRPYDDGIDYRDERPGILHLIGLVAFCLGIWAAIFYAMPIIIDGLSGV